MAETRTLKVVVVGNSKGARSALRSLGVEGDKAGSKFGRVAGKMGMAAAAVATSVAVAAGVAAKKMYEFGAPLERNLNVIKSLDPTATVEKMNGALEANAGKFAKMGVNTGEASDALLELVKAGMSSDDALASLQGTLQAAIGGGMELGAAAETVSDAINAFGLKASDAGMVANVLANAANVSSTDVSDLAQSLSMASAVAAQAKVPFSQVNAMLVELGNKGMKGSDAGTSLKTMLLHLTAPVGTGAKQLKKLGLSAFDAQGKIKSMPRIIDEFNKATAKMNDKQKAAAMSAIFGTDAIRAANIVFGAGSAKLKQYTKAVERSGGAQKAAEARTGGLSGAFARLKSQAESGAAAMYMKVAPGLAKVVNGVADMGPKVKKALAPVAKNVVNAFKGIGGGGMGKELAATGGVLKKFALDLLPVFKEFGTKLMAVLGPGLKSIGEVIRTQFLPGVRAILPVLRPVVAFILRMLGGAVIGIVKGVILVLKGAFQVIGGLFKLIAAVIHGDWSGAWTAVKTIFFGAINIIKGAILVWWNLGIIQVFRRGILKVVSGVKGFWTGLKGLFTKGTVGVKSIVGKIVDFLLAPFRRAFSGVKSYTSSGWAYIRGRFSAGVGGVKAVMGRIIEVVTYPYRRAFSLARSVVSGGWSTITRLFSAGKTRVVGVVKAIPGLIKGAFTNPLGFLKGIGGDMVQGLVNGIKNGYQAVIGAVSGLIDKIPGPIKKALGIKSPSRVLMKIGAHTADGMALGIRKGLKRVGAAASALATASVPSVGSLTALSVGAGQSGAASLSTAHAGAQGGGSVVVQVHVAGSVIKERELALTVRDELLKVSKRNGGRTGL
jgi:TP901 family phage tail tape measure protein